MALLYFVQWWRESRYSTSQLWILFGIGNCAILFINDECRTESNALEKSSPIKCTNSCFSRSTDILWSRLINAAVVEPVGRKANWSRKRCLKSGCTRTGYRYLRMIIFSRVRHSIDVTEIGRKSSHLPGWLDFGAGVMMLDFHCFGTKWKTIVKICRLLICECFVCEKTEFVIDSLFDWKPV